LILLFLCAAVWAGPGVRVVVAPPERFQDLSATHVRARVWWEGPEAEVQLAQGGRWKTVGAGSAPVEIPRVARGAAVRLRLDGAWTEPVYVPRTIGPADLARLSGPDGAMLAGTVGQIAAGAEEGTAWASTLGGGLVLAGPGRQVRSWTKWEGLPDDRVLSVSTRDAQVLVGTASGAALLDGDRVQEIWPVLGEDRHVQSVLLTDSGAWAGTPHGLHTLNPVRSIHAGSVYSLAPRGDGGIWIGQGGVRTHGPEEGTLAPDVALAGDHIYAVLPVSGGIAVASQERGVWQTSDSGLAPLSDYPDTEAYALARTSSGLWVAGGTTGLHGPDMTVYGYADGFPGRSVWSLLSGSSAESLWVGTDRGLARFSPGPEHQLAQVEVLPLTRWPADEDADDLLEAGRGLWAAGERGVWTLGRPHRWAENLVTSSPRAVVAVVQGGGRTWAVGDRVVSMDRRGSLASVPLRFRATDAAWSQGALWIGSAVGLHRLDPETLVLDAPVLLDGVRRMVGQDDGLWVAADGLPVHVVGRVTRPYLQAHPVHDLAPLDQSVCLGTDSGVELLFPSGDVTAPLGERRSGVRVTAVAHDGRGGCWYATEAGTVGRIGTDGGHASMVLPTGEVGRPSRVIPDEDWAWVVTRYGTWRVWLPVSAQP